MSHLMLLVDRIELENRQTLQPAAGRYASLYSCFGRPLSFGWSTQGVLFGLRNVERCWRRLFGKVSSVVLSVSAGTTQIPRTFQRMVFVYPISLFLGV